MKNSRIDIKMQCPRCGFWQFATVDEYDQSLVGKRLRCPMPACYNQELLPTGECRVAHFPEPGAGTPLNDQPIKKGLFSRFRKEIKKPPMQYYGTKHDESQVYRHPSNIDESSCVGGIAHRHEPDICHARMDPENNPNPPIVIPEEPSEKPVLKKQNMLRKFVSNITQKKE